MKEHLNCNFIRINPGSGEFNLINEFATIKMRLIDQKKSP